LSQTENGGTNYGFSGLYNQPIIPGVLGLRAVGFYNFTDGYIDRYPIDPHDYTSNLPGPVTHNVNTATQYGTRVVLQYKLSDSFTITPSVFLQKIELGAPFTIDQPPGSYDSPIQARDVREPTSDRFTLYALTIEGTVGGIHIISATGYRDRVFDTVEDASKVGYFYFSPKPQPYVYPQPFGNHFANHDFSQELRASTTVGRWHVLLGAFYSHENNSFTDDWSIPPGYNEAFGTPFGTAPGFETFFSGGEDDTVKQTAVFGEINFDFTHELQGTVGARYFEIKQTARAAFSGVFNNGNSSSYATSTDVGVTPKFELSYHLTPDALAYATAAKGFRQGGPLAPLPNVCDADLAAIGLTSAPTEFKADSLWNYEIGAKTEWLDHRLIVNGAAYYINWKGLQQLVALPHCGFNFTDNFGAASSKGGELEVQYEPIPSLRLTLGASYNKAQITASVAGGQGAPGDTLENSPRWLGSAAAEYHRQLGNGTSGFLRMDFFATTYQYNNFVPTSNWYTRPGYSLLNARLGATHNAWETSLFLDNALNKHTETSLPLAYSVDLPTTRRLGLNQPRTIGIEVRAHF